MSSTHSTSEERWEKHLRDLIDECQSAAELEEDLGNRKEADKWHAREAQVEILLHGRR